MKSAKLISFLFFKSDLKDICDFNFIVISVRGERINPTLHYPLRTGGRNPLFHYCIIPIVSEAN